METHEIRRLLRYAYVKNVPKLYVLKSTCKASKANTIVYIRERERQIACMYV